MQSLITTSDVIKDHQNKDHQTKIAKNNRFASSQIGDVDHRPM